MIIIGLGNPGQEYAQTRHNIGFAVITLLADKLSAAPWKEEYNVHWTTVSRHRLLQPLGYMNTSGPTIAAFLKKKNWPFDPADEFFVIHDDVDFPLGEIHEQFDRTAAGHNGVASIIEVFGQKFSRLRIGIGNNRTLNIPAEDYVLQKFSDEEKPIIDKAIIQAVETIVKKFAKK